VCELVPALKRSHNTTARRENLLTAMQDQKISSRKQLREFDIDFSVAQHVQSIRKRLYHAQTILDGTQAVLRTIADHSEKLRDLAVCSSSAHQGFVCKINNISGEIRSHKSTTHELLKLSDDIQSMVCIYPASQRFTMEKYMDFL
jgi:hypothetical protein